MLLFLGCGVLECTGRCPCAIKGFALNISGRISFTSKRTNFVIMLLLTKFREVPLYDIITVVCINTQTYIK